LLGTMEGGTSLAKGGTKPRSTALPWARGREAASGAGRGRPATARRMPRRRGGVRESRKGSLRVAYLPPLLSCVYGLR
jgi:hypothetical protein